MSIPTIQHIQQAARGGFASVDMKSGDVVSGGRGLRGKIASWFQAKLHPGETAANNSAVMHAFVRAIASDPKYGPSYANMATKELAPRWTQGKKLTQRTVSNVLNALEHKRDSVRGQNAMLGWMVGRTDLPTSRNNFGSIFREVADGNRYC